MVIVSEATRPHEKLPILLLRLLCSEYKFGLGILNCK